MSRIFVVLILTTVFGCSEYNQYERAVELETANDYSSAVSAYLLAANDGHVQSTLRLAQIYSGEYLTNADGSSYAESFTDAEQAGFYYEAAYVLLNERLDQLTPDELAVLGLLNVHGNGTRKNEDLGAIILHDAAASGSAVAQYALGNYWYWIREQTRDTDSAAKYLYQAAVQNHSGAQLALSELLMHSDDSRRVEGFNTPETWLRLAASNGSSMAKRQLASITSQ